MAIIKGCSCSTGLGNTGLGNCINRLGVTTGFALTPQYQNSGTRNGIDISIPVFTTEWTTLLTEADVSKRIFPVTGLTQIDHTDEGAQYDTDDAGIKSLIRDGIRSFAAEKREISPAFEGKLNQARCGSNAVYFYTALGVIGLRSGNMLYPIPINAFYSRYRMAINTAVDKVMIAFDVDPNVDFADLWLVPFADLNTTYFDQKGLRDVNFQVIHPTVTAAGTTTLALRLTTDYGQGLVNKQTLAGLDETYFKVYDRTGLVDVPITVVTELVDDHYIIQYASTIPQDVMELSMVTSTGFYGTFTYNEPA